MLLFDWSELAEGSSFKLCQPVVEDPWGTISGVGGKEVEREWVWVMVSEKTVLWREK